MRLSALLLALLLFCTACTPGIQMPFGPAGTEAIDLTPAPPEPQETPAPTETPMPTASPAPTPTPPPGPLYKVRVSTVNVRSSPSAADGGNILGQLLYEETAYYLGTEGEFSRVQLMDGTEAYCYAEYLVPEETVLYAYVPPETGQKIDIPTGLPAYEADGVTPIMVKNELVDLKLYLPDAQYEQLFNTENNVTGEPLYGRSIALLQRDTAKKLVKAYERFKADGYTLKIYDAYRPLSAQRRLFEIVQNKHWIADPSTTASNHNRGCAVDIALIDDATGLVLEFPTPMHTFTEEAARTCKTWTEEQAANVEYMTGVMSECGFNTIKSEWWHFSDTNSKKFMTTDIDLSRVTMLPLEQLPEKDLGVEIGGKVYYLREDSAALLAALGDGFEYSEMVSCVYDGKDKTYTYPGITVNTVPVGGKDVIEMITLTDGTYATLRGAKVGDALSSVTELYGADYFDDGYLTYSITNDPEDIEAERIQFEPLGDAVGTIYIYSPSY